MPNIYDDPRVKGTMVPRLRFERVGDRGRGVVTEADIFTTNTNTGFRYTLAEVVARQEGNQLRLDQAELMAGTRNMVEQLLIKQPQVGDILDVELIELKPSSYGNPAKLYRVNVDKQTEGQPLPRSETPSPAPASPGDEDDLFQ